MNLSLFCKPTVKHSAELPSLSQCKCNVVTVNQLAEQVELGQNTTRDFRLTAVAFFVFLLFFSRNSDHC